MQIHPSKDLGLSLQERKSVIYTLKFLTSMEINNAWTEKVMYAIVFDCEHFY